MRYEDIKDFIQRCEEHPDHQSGMVTDMMIRERLEEEIDDLRAYIESVLRDYIRRVESELAAALALNKMLANRQWVGLTDKDLEVTDMNFKLIAHTVEDILKEKNSGS